jgi:hypothetical protein
MRGWIVVVALGLAGQAYADEPVKELPKDRLGIDALYVLPTDDYGAEADAGLGALVRYERRVGSKLHLAARGGPLFHVSNIDGHSLTMLLAFAGMRYNLDPDVASGTFFTMAIGFNYVRSGASAGGVEVSDSEPEIALDLGVGFQVKTVQVRGSLFYTPHVGASFSGDTTSYLGLALTIGYDFVVR